jgi:hypothetical protein
MRRAQIIREFGQHGQNSAPMLYGMGAWRCKRVLIHATRLTIGASWPLEGLC